MIWALQRLANLMEQGKLTFSVHFKSSGTYLESIGDSLSGQPPYSYPLGTTCWYVRLDIDGWLPTVPADTIEAAATKAVLLAEAELRKMAGTGALGEIHNAGQAQDTSKAGGKEGAKTPGGVSIQEGTECD